MVSASFLPRGKEGWPIQLSKRARIQGRKQSRIPMNTCFAATFQATLTAPPFLHEAAVAAAESMPIRQDGPAAEHHPDTHVDPDDAVRGKLPVGSGEVNISLKAVLTHAHRISMLCRRVGPSVSVACCLVAPTACTANQGVAACDT